MHKKSLSCSAVCCGAERRTHAEDSDAAFDAGASLAKHEINTATFACTAKGTLHLADSVRSLLA